MLLIIKNTQPNLNIIKVFQNYKNHELFNNWCYLKIFQKFLSYLDATK